MSSRLQSARPARYSRSSARGVPRGARRLLVAQRSADRVADPLGASRVQPDVRVAGLDIESWGVQQLDHLAIRVLGRPLQGRLETLAEQQHEVGRLDVLHIFGSGLEVVRFGAGRRQVLHVHGAAADLAGGESQWVEAGGDGLPASADGVVAPDCEGEHDPGDDHAQDGNDNDSHSRSGANIHANGEGKPARRASDSTSSCSLRPCVRPAAGGSVGGAVPRGGRCDGPGHPSAARNTGQASRAGNRLSSSPRSLRCGGDRCAAPRRGRDVLPALRGRPSPPPRLLRMPPGRGAADCRLRAGWRVQAPPRVSWSRITRSRRGPLRRFK